MRGGTHRLAACMVVVCVAATACGAAQDRDAGRTAKGTAAARGASPLAVKVGSDPRALAVVEGSRLRPVAHRRTGPPPPVLRRRISPQDPLRVAFVGDSVAYSLLLTLGATAADLTQTYHVPLKSTAGFQGPGFGLTADVDGFNDIGPTPPASAYANWLDSVRKIVTENDPDTVLVMLGIWDTIERHPGGRVLRPGMPEWKQWYGLLAAQFVRTLTARGADVVWLVMPCVGRPDLNARLAEVNSVLRESWRAAPGRVGYVDLSKAACRDGVPIYELPSQLGPVRVRMADGIHFSPVEAPALLRKFLVQRFVALLRAAHALPVSSGG